MIEVMFVLDKKETYTQTENESFLKLRELGCSWVNTITEMSPEKDREVYCAVLEDNKDLFFSMYYFLNNRNPEVIGVWYDTGQKHIEWFNFNKELYYSYITKIEIIDENGNKTYKDRETHQVMKWSGWPDRDIS